MLAAVLGGLAFQVPVGRLSDRFDRRIVPAALGVGLAGASSRLDPPTAHTSSYPAGRGPARRGCLDFSTLFAWPTRSTACRPIGSSP